MINHIQRLNPALTINDVTDQTFRPYGKLHTYMNSYKLVSEAEKFVSIPDTGNQYVASVQIFEKFEIVKQIQKDIFGDLPVEIGTCAGNSTQLTGVEFHQGSEVILSVTDCVLILGKVQDIENNKYDSNLVEYFYVPKGSVVELYGTTLHYNPCKVHASGFITLVILLDGTNEIQDRPSTAQPLLSKINKFLMVHPTQKEKIATGVHDGFTGPIPEIQID